MPKRWQPKHLQKLETFADTDIETNTNTDTDTDTDTNSDTNTVAFKDLGCKFINANV